MELIAFLAFFVIEGFVLWTGFVIGWNRCCKRFERERRRALRTTPSGDRC
jgi:hypothetical protein